MAQRGATRLKEVKKQADRTADMAQDEADTAGAAVSEELAQLSRRIEELADTLSDQARSAAETAAEKTGTLGRHAARQAREARQHTAAAVSGAERLAAERPALAVGVAAGAGVLAGLLLARR